MTTNFHYYVSKQFTISDVDYCSASDRTFDIKFFDLANNEKLLNTLQLWHLEGGFGSNVTDEYRCKWFSNYLSAFSNHAKPDKYAKALTNPTVRLLITDNDMLTKVRSIFNH